MLKFQKDKLHIDANAAPLIPEIPKWAKGLLTGINIRLRDTLIIAPKNIIIP